MTPQRAGSDEDIDDGNWLGGEHARGWCGRQRVREQQDFESTVNNVIARIGFLRVGVGFVGGADIERRCPPSLRTTATC